VYKNTYHPAVQAFRCSGVQKAGAERLFREKEMTVEMILGFWLLSGEEGTQSVFAYDPADTTLADQMRNTINLRLSMGAAMTRTTAPFALKFVRDNFGAVTWSGDRKLAKLRALRAEIAKVKEAMIAEEDYDAGVAHAAEDNPLERLVRSVMFIAGPSRPLIPGLWVGGIRSGSPHRTHRTNRSRRARRSPYESSSGCP
jgi:hypothetical protein